MSFEIQYYEYQSTKSTRTKSRVFGEFYSRKFNNRIMFINFVHKFLLLLSMFSSLDPTNRLSKYNLHSESVLQICQKYMDELYLRTSSECLRKLIGKTLNYPRQLNISLSLSSGVWWIDELNAWNKINWNPNNDYRTKHQEFIPPLIAGSYY